MEEILHKKANKNALLLLPIHRGINKTSGGIGKNDASENDNMVREICPLGLSANRRTQSYMFFKKFNYFCEIMPILDITSLCLYKPIGLLINLSKNISALDPPPSRFNASWH